MKILIAEDDFVNRQLLTSMLDEFGVCEIASNGLEAIQACRAALEEAAPYDLILMDIMMPHVSGLEALDKLRAMEKERGIQSHDAMKVVMITSLDDPKNIALAFYKGEALSYIVKPIDKAILIAEIRKLRLID